MIVPIHGLRYHKFEMPSLKDDLKIIKERENIYDKEAIAAYNKSNQKIGYISRNSCFNSKVYKKMQEDIVIGKVWAIFPNQILIELDFK
jgi:hypothetical protein